MDLPKEVFGIIFKPSLEKENKGGVESLAQQWAKKYLQNLQIDEDDKQTTNKVSLKEAVSQAGREKTAYKLMESLRSISAKAWNKTESLLAAKVKRHLTTSRYASTLVGAYFKVIDDRLYMPLQRAYAAAAKHDYDSHALSAVQQLLPNSTQIAKNVFQMIIKIYPNYRFYTGLLSESVVKTSCIRDVEMFQVYFSVCALEGDISKGSTRVISIVCHALSHIKSAVGTYSSNVALVGTGNWRSLDSKTCRHLNAIFSGFVVDVLSRSVW